MKTLYFSINPNQQGLYMGHLFQFLFVTLIVLFIWYALYKLLSTSQTRRKKFKYWKTIPRKWAFFIGGCTGLLIIGYIYIDNWSYFFRIDIQENNLQLHYSMPKRTITISTENISELVAKKEWRKTPNYRLIIKTQEGKEYSSSLIGSNLFHKNMKELKQTLIINN